MSQVRVRSVTKPLWRGATMLRERVRRTREIEIGTRGELGGCMYKQVRLYRWLRGVVGLSRLAHLRGFRVHWWHMRAVRRLCNRLDGDGGRYVRIVRDRVHPRVGF